MDQRVMYGWALAATLEKLHVRARSLISCLAVSLLIDDAGPWKSNSSGVLTGHGHVNDWPDLDALWFSG